MMYNEAEQTEERYCISTPNDQSFGETVAFCGKGRNAEE